MQAALKAVPVAAAMPAVDVGAIKEQASGVDEPFVLFKRHLKKDVLLSDKIPVPVAPQGCTTVFTELNQAVYVPIVEQAAGAAGTGVMVQAANEFMNAVSHAQQVDVYLKYL